MTEIKKLNNKVFIPLWIPEELHRSLETEASIRNESMIDLFISVWINFISSQLKQELQKEVHKINKRQRG